MRNLCKAVLIVLVLAISAGMVQAAEYERVNINDTFTAESIGNWDIKESVYATVTASPEDEENKALKIVTDEEGGKITRSVDGAGYLNIVELDIYFGEFSSDLYVPAFKNSNGKEMLKVHVDAEDNVKLIGNKTNNTKLKIKRNAWNHFRYNINMNTGVYSMAINEDAAVYNAALAGTFPASIGAIEFTAASAAELYIDNVIIRNCGLFSADFEGDDDAELINAGSIFHYTYSSAGNSGPVEDPSNSGNKCLMLARNYEIISFPAIASYGEIEFDIMFSDVDKALSNIYFGTKYDRKGAVILLNAENGLYDLNNGAQSMQTLRDKYSSNTWYRVKMELDVEKQNYKFYMTNDDSETLIQESGGAFAGEYGYIDSLMFEIKQSCYIDNLQVWDRSISAPRFNGLSIVEANGNILANAEHAGIIPANADSISVDLIIDDEGKGIDAEIETASVNENSVYLFDTDANKKVYMTKSSFDSQNGRFTMSLGEYLERDHKYKLFVTDDIKNTLSYKIFTSQQINLTPAAQKVFVDKNAIQAELVENRLNIEIPAINCLGDEAPVKVYAGIYSEDGLLKQPISKKDAMLSISDEIQPISTYIDLENSVDEGDKLKIFVWDETDAPLCSEAIISLT